MDFNFSAAPLDSEPCVVNLMFENTGTVATEWYWFFYIHVLQESQRISTLSNIGLWFLIVSFQFNKIRSFLFPTDLQLELEYWAETGEFDEDELHEVCEISTPTHNIYFC